MSDRSTFIDLDVDEVLRAVEEHWDLSGPWPIPRGQWLSCPICRNARVQARTWTRHTQAGHQLEHRVDVSFKCVECSAAWVHGVAVPPAYGRRFARRLNEHVGWRAVKASNDNYTDRINQEETP